MTHASSTLCRCGIGNYQDQIAVLAAGSLELMAAAAATQILQWQQEQQQQHGRPLSTATDETATRHAAL